MTCEKCVYFYYFRHHFIDGRTAIIFDIISLFCFRTLIHDVKKKCMHLLFKGGKFSFTWKTIIISMHIFIQIVWFQWKWKYVRSRRSADDIISHRSILFSRFSLLLFVCFGNWANVCVCESERARAHAHTTTLAYSFQTNVSDQVID